VPLQFCLAAFAACIVLAVGAGFAAITLLPHFAVA
jgi:hypothetical protein